MAALTRMARGDHYHINIRQGDTVIISASAIPGNERFIGETINQLYKRVLRLSMKIYPEFMYLAMPARKN